MAGDDARRQAQCEHDKQHAGQIAARSALGHLSLSDNGRLYHRAECLTHVGDSPSWSDLDDLNGGERNEVRMAAPIALRNDFDSGHSACLAKRPGNATSAEPSTLPALAEVYDARAPQQRMRRGSAGAGLQSIRDWVPALQRQRRPDAAGRWEVTGRTLEAQRRSRAVALAEVVEAGPVPSVGGRRRRALAAHATWRPVALGDVRQLARRDHGRAAS